MNDFKKVWVAISLSQVAILLLFGAVLAVAMQARTVNDQANVSLLPVKGDKGDTAEVDYEKVDQVIAGKIAQIPRPKDGKTGKAGKNGAPAPIARKVEARINPDSLSVEWRCAGDTLWTTLLTTPILADSCL